MALTSRFAIDTTVLVVGAFLAVVSFAFSAPVAGWIGFGVFVGMICLAVDGLDQASFMDAPPERSKYSTLMSYIFPAVSATDAWRWVAPWKVQSLTSTFPSTQRRTPSSLVVKIV